MAPASSATVAMPSVDRGDLAAEQVGRADEAVDEQGLRPVVDRDRRIELLDLALVHHGDAVGDAHRLVLVVRHQDGGEAERALQALDLDLHVEPQVAVERGERLVEQQDRRLDGERAGERHALLLAARELARQAIAEAAELHRLEEAIDLGGDLRPAHAARAQAVGDVLRHRHVREQGVVLEDDADVALVGRQVVDRRAVDPHAARGLADEAGDRRAAGWSCRSPTGRAAPRPRRARSTGVTPSTAMAAP